MRSKHQYTTNNHQFAFSLIELMVAMVLGLTIVAAVATLSLNATRSYRVMNQAGELIENGRYAIKLIKDELEHAGYYGLFAPTVENVPDPVLTDPCSLDPSNLEKSFLLPVIGYTSNPGNCVPSGVTRVLAVRRAEVKNINDKQYEEEMSYEEYKTYIEEKCANKICLNTWPGGYIIGALKDPSTSSLYAPASKTSFIFDQKKAPIVFYYVTLYFVSNQSLMRRVQTTGNPVTQPVVDGIEDLQFQFGLDDGTAPGMASDGTPDRFLSADSIVSMPNPAEAWQNVVAVRINVLARSLEADGNYIDTKSYDLNPYDSIDGEVSPKSDNYHRRVFSQVVRLINVSGRRE